ncbi:unnamed protein product [Peronospora destructor]|nr:unnamed protein product [Peronospora destructor]
MFALETRAKLLEIKEEVRQKIEDSMEEVETLQQTAVENVVDTGKGRQETVGAGEREKELEVQTQELRQLQELERLQELEKKKMLERERIMEMNKMENQYKQSEIPKASSSDLNGESVVMEKAAMTSEGHKSAVKRLLAWYVFTEHTLLEAATTIYRQFVLPVVAIIGFFLVLAVAIGRYNAVKKARRNRRVLYSGYPKSYRPKPHSETKRILADVRPRVRNPVLRHDSDGYVGN